MPEESSFQNNSVFFIDVDKISPNPYQPRHDFDEARLAELADSIRMYGLLQPLTVSRKEVQKPDGGIATEYELIAGERRLRASKLIGLREVPALIRSKEDDARTKLELAIIENLQREDLSAIDRARAFARLVDEFGFKHVEIAKKVGKSREYVSNTIRLLLLSEEMQNALQEKKISEGHTRPLLMLADRPEEQMTLFREIMLKKMSVRDAERISRKIAIEKVRKHDRTFGSDIVELEQFVGDVLGTRVHIQPKEKGGKIEIDYFSEEDLREILHKISNKEHENSLKSGAGNYEDFTDATSVEVQNEDLEGADEIRHSKDSLSEESENPSEAPLDLSDNKGPHYDILNPEPDPSEVESIENTKEEPLAVKSGISFTGKPSMINNLDSIDQAPPSIPIVPNSSNFVPPVISDMKMPMSGNGMASDLQAEIEKQIGGVVAEEVKLTDPLVKTEVPNNMSPNNTEINNNIDKYREDPGTVSYPLPSTPDTPLHNGISPTKSSDDGDFTINDFKI